MKKIISFILILTLWFFHIIGYAYDAFFVSYNLNKTQNSANLLYVKKSDNIKINTYKNTFLNNDWSKTIVEIKWLNISLNHLNFLTKGIWLFVFDNNSKDVKIENKNKDLTPFKEFVFTSNNNLTKKAKEKNIFDNYIFDSFDLFNSENIFLVSFICHKKQEKSIFLRWPPYIISLTMI